MPKSVAFHPVTPAGYKRSGKQMRVHYGFHPTPFGECLLGLASFSHQPSTTHFSTGADQGICALFFVEKHERPQALAKLRNTWSLSALSEDATATKPLSHAIFAHSRVTFMPTLYVKGSPFQIKVWRALLRIPRGETCAYETLAHTMGKPTATRAVANAVGANLVSYLIPCHRVLRKDGGIGGYRWGLARKRAMLSHEAIG